MVSQKLIDEFKTIIKDDYGRDLDTKEAAQIIENLVGYFDLLAKIYHRTQTYENTKPTNE